MFMKQSHEESNTILNARMDKLSKEIEKTKVLNSYCFGCSPKHSILKNVIKNSKQT